MFSALKKFVTNDQNAGRGLVPTGMQTMGQNLQRRFAKGVQYNMKIIIKGDRNTGKTTLFHRLQGERFKEEYIPTPEIQVTSIQWNYKATDDVVKVEVWDVVDKGKSKKKADGLKLDTAHEVDETDEPCLDASFLNVYKGANGVVFLVDITKQWTWGYVERELPNVPDHIPVLVLASFRDIAEHRTVAEDTMRYFIDNFERPPDSAKVLLAEASMKNGFGLKYLHTFFNVPFLQLQRETLLRQLETNNLETSATLDELDMRKESEDQNYNLYIESLEERRRQRKAKAASPTTLTPTVPNGRAPQTTLASPGNNQGSSRSTPVMQSPATTPKQNTPTSTPATSRKNPLPAKEAQQEQRAPRAKDSAREAGTPPPTTDKQAAAQASSLSQRFSKWFGGGESRVQQGTKEEDLKEAVIETVAEVTPGPITSVDEFIPDDGLGGFLDDDDGPGRKKGKPKKKVEKVVAKPPPPTQESDSDEEVNPMVASFQEELDSEDDITPFKPTNSDPQFLVTSSYDVDLSSDGEDVTAITQDRDVSPEDDDVDENDVYKSLKLKSISTNHKQSPLLLSNQDGVVSVFSSTVEEAQKEADMPTWKSSEKQRNGSETASPLSPQYPTSTDSTSEDEHVHQPVSRTSSQTTDQDTSTASPASPMIQLQQEDFNFLENVGSTKKPGLTKKLSLPADDFDNLLAVAKDEDISDTDTVTSTSTSSSAVKKKKKHKSKDKDAEDEKSSRKHRHKKQKDKGKDPGRHGDKGDGDEKKRKKKKPRGSDGEVSAEAKPAYDELEAFLEGPSLGSPSSGPSYEAL